MHRGTPGGSIGGPVITRHLKVNKSMISGISLCKKHFVCMQSPISSDARWVVFGSLADLANKNKKRNLTQVKLFTCKALGTGDLTADEISNAKQKIADGTSLTDREMQWYDALGEIDRFDLYASLTSGRAIESSYLKERDIIGFTLCFKNTNVKQLTSKSHFVQDQASSSNGNSTNIEALNFASKETTFYLACQSIKGSISPFELINALATQIFDGHIKYLINSSILVEVAAVSRVFPTKRKSARTSIGLVNAGRLDEQIDSASNRSFIINLASKGVQTSKDDASIRLPWCSTRLSDINSIAFDGIKTQSVVSSFCKMLAKPLVLSFADELGSQREVMLSFMLRTRRSSAPFPYWVIDYASPTGYASAAMGSASLFIKKPNTNGSSSGPLKFPLNTSGDLKYNGQGHIPNKPLAPNFKELPDILVEVQNKKAIKVRYLDTQLKMVETHRESNDWSKIIMAIQQARSKQLESEIAWLESREYQIEDLIEQQNKSMLSGAEAIAQAMNLEQNIKSQESDSLIKAEISKTELAQQGYVEKPSGGGKL